ncbi:MAG: hypothetical protein ACI9VX_002625 [Dinoroseobacter sp.]
MNIKRHGVERSVAALIGLGKLVNGQDWRHLAFLSG